MGLHDVPISIAGKLQQLPSTDAPPPRTSPTAKDSDDASAMYMAEDFIKQNSEPDAEPYTPPVPQPTMTIPGVARKGRTPSPKAKTPTPVPPHAPMPMFSGPKRWPDQQFPIAVVPEAIVAKRDKLDIYKDNKKRISFIMESGTFMVSVVDLVATAYSVAVITASESDACNFVPAIGSKFKLEGSGFCYDCIYPGSRATISELGIDILFLIRES